jgi:hypothetical protein
LKSFTKIKMGLIRLYLFHKISDFGFWISDFSVLTNPQSKIRGPQF